MTFQPTVLVRRPPSPPPFLSPIKPHQLISEFVHQENSGHEFKWVGKGMLVFKGEHSFRFEPSKTTPGSTTFIQSEEFFLLMALMMSSTFGWDKGTKAGFEGFNKDLKARCERS